jgi:hypothetical protein
MMAILFCSHDVGFLTMRTFMGFSFRWVSTTQMIGTRHPRGRRNAFDGLGSPRREGGQLLFQDTCPWVGGSRAGQAAGAAAAAAGSGPFKRPQCMAPSHRAA